MLTISPDNPQPPYVATLSLLLQQVCLFTNSGSEANDLAMALAREHTGAFDFISLKQSYHGCSPYTVGLTAYSFMKHTYANG